MTMTERRRISGYEVIAEVGRGGMATVYLARQNDLNREVALKELSSFYSADSSVVDRFLRESQLAGSLNHPNIVTVHRFFEHDGVPYIAMEYLPRGSLRPYVGTLSFAQFVGVMEGVLAGLTHAENKNVVHRDLKPENLMVTDDGRVKITDFGIAKATVTSGLGTFLTKDGMTVGTPSYMAPEQAVASKDIGPWTDLYSVGVMAYEHLTGRPPFCDAAAAIILFRHVSEPIRPVVEVNRDVDRELSEWVDRLLAKNPGDRIRSPVAAWEQLEDIAVRRSGALWRRQARLPSPTRVRSTSRPLTPAPFESHSTVASGPNEPRSVGPAETGYLTFGHVEPPPPAPPPETPSGRHPVSDAVIRLCAALAGELSDSDARTSLAEIQRDLGEAVEEQAGAHLDAARAANAMRRIEELPWPAPDLALVRDRMEQLQEKGVEMQLVSLARWWARSADGEVELPADKRDELSRLLSADSAPQRVGLDGAASEKDVREAAHRRALTWRAFESSAHASPMARRLAAAVVRFYERMSTAGEERAA